MLAEHALDPELQRILTLEAARLRTPHVETESDAALSDEAALWSAGTRRKNAELALWIAKTAVHAVVHLAFVERPHDARNPAALAEELTRLVVKYLAPERSSQLGSALLPGARARQARHRGRR